ncbi:diadenylate cyclase CdaA [Isobaculum melis]|uniref:Diadenylate cyclase n=1 Tax=Isobaculum melis TaxID=142588 RepID=A0A1H9TFM8_9LACT|nr:diadenylate cyclase CdaA [Isobaculum melis]SER95847.1 diadenylate cyclase [Isobaculum melis]
MSIDWSTVFTWHQLANVIDVLVVWFCIYKLILMVRGTKAVQLLRGIVIILVIKIISEYVGLQTIAWIMDRVIQWGVLATIIIFQPELRRGLEHLGRGSLFGKAKRETNQTVKMIDGLDKAVQYMAKRRIGALISIEKETRLDEYIATGIPLDADISGELLINIFIPNTPLHDGAVLIKQNKIAAAAGYLPLSENPFISKELGTRHRAAIGLSEVSDALTIIVSEETGEVSIAQNSELMRDLTHENFVKVLEQQLVTPDSKKKPNMIQEFISGITRRDSK